MLANANLATFRDTFLLLETFELGLNFAGYIPVVGTLSTGLRAIMAKVELIAGVVLAVLYFGLQAQGKTINPVLLNVGLTFMGHALLNVIRCLFEAVPFVALVTTLPYDFYATHVLGKRLFSYV